MNSIFESLAKGLTEAIKFEQSKNTARRNTIEIEPPAEFNADDIKTICRQTGIPESK